MLITVPRNWFSVLSVAPKNPCNPWLIKHRFRRLQKWASASTEPGDCGRSFCRCLHRKKIRTKTPKPANSSLCALWLKQNPRNRCNPWLDIIEFSESSVPSVAKKSAFFVIFLLTLFEFALKYPYVSLSLRGQQANINRQQAIDIAENRTFSYQQIHAKKHYLSSQTRFWTFKFRSSG